MEVSGQRVRAAGCCTPTGQVALGTVEMGCNSQPSLLHLLGRGEGGGTGAGMLMQEKREWA